MKKLVSILISFSLLLPPAFSVEGAAETNPLSLANLAIPESLGKIEERFVGKSGRWVIHIQDVHAHFAAQENIAAILNHLNDLYDVKTVALEGAWSSTSFPKSWAIPPSRDKQLFVRTLMEEDYLTGPAYASIFAKTPITLVGIEEEKPYEENRRLYLKYLAMREEITAKIEAYRQKILTAKQETFNPALLNFDKALSQYREGREAEKFIPSLVVQMHTKNIDTGGLKQIEIFKEIMKTQASIDKVRLESEAKRLLKLYKRSGLHFEELLRSQKIPQDQLKYYDETQKYLYLMQLEDRIDHRAFFDEIEEAIARFKESLAISEGEKALMEKSERFYLAKRLAMLQATPDDVTAWKEQPEQMTAPEMEEAGLAEALQWALDFYSVAAHRDEIFFQKITTDNRLAGDAALVTGGFHTAGLSRKLQEAGISYIVITPDLAGGQPNDELYFNRLQENFSSTQTLSELRNSILNADEAFTAGFSRFGITKDLSKGIETFRSELRLIQAEPPPPALNWFSLAPGKQWQEARKLQQEQVGKLRIVYIFKRSEMRKLLDDPLGAVIFEKEIFPRPENTVVILMDEGEIPMETIGVRAEVRRVPGTDISAALSGQKIQQALSRRLVGVIGFEIDAKSLRKQYPNLVLFALNPVSPFLVRPVLENGRNLPFQDQNFLALLSDLLTQIYQTAGLLEKQA